MLQNPSGGTTPTPRPGYVGLEVRTLPLSNLVRGAGSGLGDRPGRCWGG